ncbi:MAG: hypothetical protein IJU79_04485 [Desulfovibrionaceae bacterium]|nr:hypothetical protein [Desulfovibrionaceae bacterium]
MLSEVHSNDQLSSTTKNSNIAELDHNDVSARLLELSHLQFGWLEANYGEPLSKNFLNWFDSAYKQYFATELPAPYIFPTPEGGITLEWQSERHIEISVEINCKTRIGEFVSAKKDQDEMTEETVDLNNAKGWMRLNALLSDEFLQV